MRRGTAGLLICLYCAGVLAAGMQVEVIPLKHRLASDVIPILQPLLAPAGTLTGSANQLIIRSTPENIGQIKQALAGIDRAPRRLLISVRQDRAGNAGAERRSLSGSYSGGGVSVSGRDRGGVVISSRGEGDNHIEYQSSSRSRSSADRNTFTVQALEGNPAFIQAGSLVPLPARTTVVTRGGVVQQDSVQLYDATSGFYVLPRLSGDSVTLLVAPRLAGGGAGGFHVQNVETTVSGRLGEWLHVGGMTRQNSRRDGGPLSQSQRQNRMRSAVEIKVEELDAGR